MPRFVDDWRDRWFDVVDWYDDVPGRRKVMAAAIVVALLGGVAVWQLQPGSDTEEVGEELSAPDAEGADTPVTTAPAAPTTSSASADSAPEATTPGSTAPGSTVEEAAASTTVAAPTDSVASAAPATTEPQTAAGAPPATAAAPAAPTAGGAVPPYPISPDGSPLPLVVVFDTETITISGQVPSQAAKDRLTALAKANSQFPDAQVVDNMVINPAVPISVGVRVIELNSARFPPGSADILPEHALELDRVANIMRALPNLSVLVIGHADQRGDDLVNFAISDERARAVVNYLIYLGISHTRLASRAAGEADLLTVGDDDASLALNRRTEFIFGGLLIE